MKQFFCQPTTFGMVGKCDFVCVKFKMGLSYYTKHQNRLNRKNVTDRDFRIYNINIRMFFKILRQPNSKQNSILNLYPTQPHTCTIGSQRFNLHHPPPMKDNILIRLHLLTDPVATCSIIYRFHLQNPPVQNPCFSVLYTLSYETKTIFKSSLALNCQNNSVSELFTNSIRDRLTFGNHRQRG